MNIDQFIRAVLLSGLSVSAERLLVIHAYTQATHEEYKEQQKLIVNGFKFEENLKVGMDTSFSQGQNARFSQTGCRENKPGEIVRMVVLDKQREKCISNKMEAIGFENLSVIASNQKSLYQYRAVRSK